MSKRAGAVLDRAGEGGQSHRMPDVLGYRAKFGVLVPSTNTVVEPDFYAMAPPGVTLHTGRISITNPRMEDDAGMEALMVQIRASIGQAVRDVMTCEPGPAAAGSKPPSGPTPSPL